MARRMLLLMPIPWTTGHLRVQTRDGRGPGTSSASQGLRVRTPRRRDLGDGHRRTPVEADPLAGGRPSRDGQPASGTAVRRRGGGRSAYRPQAVRRSAGGFKQVQGPCSARSSGAIAAGEQRNRPTGDWSASSRRLDNRSAVRVKRGAGRIRGRRQVAGGRRAGTPGDLAYVAGRRTTGGVKREARGPVKKLGSNPR